MSDNDIQGTITDGNGNPVEGATVYLFKQSSPNVIKTTTTDANGDYIFRYHPDESGTSQEWYVTAYYDDGSQLFNTLSKPSVTAQLSPTVPDSGVARWTFDTADTESGTTLDSWGSNDGTINGATTGVTGANQTYTTNEAYSFDGTDDYIQLPFAPSWDYVSYSAWVKTSASSSNITVFGDSWSPYNAFRIRDGVVRLTVDTGSATDVDATITVADGSWHHIVGTHDGSTQAVYVDGSLDTEVSDVSGAISHDPANAEIGSRTDGGLYFEGTIDDMRIYDKALSSTEVSNLYNTGSING